MHSTLYLEMKSFETLPFHHLLFDSKKLFSNRNGCRRISIDFRKMANLLQRRQTDASQFPFLQISIVQVVLAMIKMGFTLRWIGFIDVVQFTSVTVQVEPIWWRLKRICPTDQRDVATSCWILTFNSGQFQS